MSDLVKLFFSVTRGSIRFFWYPTKPFKALWPPDAFLAESEKGRGRKIIFPHRVGSVTFFDETRDTILSTGAEIRSPHGVLGQALFWRKCLEM